MTRPCRNAGASVVRFAAALLVCLPGPGADAAADDTVWLTSFERADENIADRITVFEGARIEHRYEQASSGEEFLLVTGLNEYYQYSFESQPIPVEPGRGYVLSFAYKFSPKVTRYGINVYAIGFDENRAPVPLPLDGWAEDDVGTFYPVHGPGNGQWQTSRKTFTPPPGVRWIALRFRHGSLPVDEWVAIDNMSIVKDQPRVGVDFTIDSEAGLLTGRVRLKPASLLSDVKRYRVLLREYDPEADRRPIFISPPPPGETHLEPYYNTDYSIQVVGDVRRERILGPDETDFTFDLAGEPDRAYCLSVVAELADGTPLASVDTVEDSIFHVMRNPPWRDSLAGVLRDEDPPPPPWTALTYEESSRQVLTWNNRLAFGLDLSLERIRFQHNRGEALGRPGVQLVVNGAPLAQQVLFEPPRVIRRTPHTLELGVEGSGEWFDVSLKATIEFDGFVKYDLRLTARQATTLHRIEAVIPIRDGFARFVHPADYRRITVLDDKQPAWRTDGFEPSVWIGNEETGLVFCTNARAGKPDAVLPASLEAGRFEATLLDEPVVLQASESCSLTYAVQPTPTRPRLAPFRDLDMRDPEQSDLELLWSNPPYFAYPGVPVVGNDEAARWARQIKDRPGSPWAMFYQSTAFHMTTIPAATWFADRWRSSQEFNAYINEMPGWTHWSGDLIPVNFNDPLWQDYYCDTLDHFLEQTDFDGLYFDVSGGGLGDEGDLFRRREFHKRIYVILKRHRPDGIELFHTINHRSTPYVGFADLFCRGEAYRVDLFDHAYYLQFMTLDQFRAATAASTGSGVMFLPQYRQLHKQTDPLLAAHVMGLVLLHDMNIWPSWMNGEVIERVRQFRRVFGPLDEAHFFGYWDSRSRAFFETGDPRVVASVFERDGNLFAVLLNQSDQRVQASVRFHEAALNSHAAMRAERHATFFDPADGQTVSSNVNDLWSTPVLLPIQPYQCRLMRLQ